MPLILPGNVASATAGGFEVANSCRFNDGDSAYMHKTPGGDGSSTVFTFSCWVKRGQLGTLQTFFSAGTANKGQLVFDAEDQLKILDDGAVIAETSRVFRDTSAWYHIVLAYNTGESGTDKVKIYVNGVQETAFATDGRDGAGSLNYVNSTEQQNYFADTSNFFDGYVAEVVMIDGSQLAATSFGEFDEDSPTIWKPIDVSGLTFGTNGFYLDFEAS